VTYAYPVTELIDVVCLSLFDLQLLASSLFLEFKYFFLLSNMFDYSDSRFI